MGLAAESGHARGGSSRKSPAQRGGEEKEGARRPGAAVRMESTGVHDSSGPGSAPQRRPFHRDAGRLVARSKKPATGVSLGGGLRLYREIRYGTPSDPLPPGTGKPTVVYAIRSRAPQSWWKRTGEERTDPESRGDRYPRQQYQFQKFWIPHEWPLVEIWPNRWVIRGRAGILRRGKASGSRGTPHGLPASQYTPLTLIRPKRHFFESDVRPPVGQVGPAPTRLIAVSRQKHLNPRVAGAYRPPDWAFWELRVGSGGHPSERGYQKPAENCDVVAITVNQYGVPTAVRCETAADVVKGQLEWDSYWAHSGAMD